MDKFSIQNIQNIDTLKNELEFEKASALFLQLRVLEKKEESYIPIRNHLRELITDYEKKNWLSEEHISDEKVRESDLAEALVQAENEFYYKRKELIKSKLKTAKLNQNDLARILGHGKGYMSELINGLRPFSKDDLVVIHRLFKIKLEDLMPTFIKYERALHIKNTLDTISNHKIRLVKKDFDLQIVRE